jgi:uncharacterized protein (TIGR02453 family)
MKIEGSEVKFSREAFRFLEHLDVNNNREWFAENRSTYVQQLKEPFAEVLMEASRLLAKARIPLKGGEQTTFRINRDVRFSADKTPYSTHVSGVLTRTGRKDLASALVYVNLNEAGGFLAGGLYRPQVSRLEPIRRGMVAHEKNFISVVNNLHLAGLELDDSETTKTMPKGFADLADHPQAPWIRLKNIMATRPMSQRDWTSGAAPQLLAEFTLSVSPLLDFLDKHEGSP